VRRVRSQQATSFMGLLTAVYGVGQIAGPPLAAWLVARSASAAEGFSVSLWIASALLAIGAVLYLAIARAYPMVQRTAT
jgi:MFS family permease